MIDQKSIYEVVVSEGSYFLKIPLVITSLNHNNEKNFPVATAVGMQFFFENENNRRVLSTLHE